MTDQLDGQESLFGPDTPSMKTSQDLRPQTTAKTSRQSSRTSSASSSRKLPIFLRLTRADGPTRGGSLEWEPTVSPFPSLGVCTMRSTTVYPNGEKDTAFWLTSPGLRPLGFCLTLNLSERPRLANPSRLSEILVTDADPKYRLSAKACQGILNRAERRGKELPPELKAALEAQARTTTQSACRETGSTELRQRDATEPDGDEEDHTRSIRLTDPQSSASRNAQASRGGQRNPPAT